MISLHTFPRELRLLTPAHFNAVFSSGLRIKSPNLTFVIKPNNLPYPRIGFALAKKQIKRAHERNRIKRLIREYFRLNQQTIPNIDIIVMARTPIQSLTNLEISNLIAELFDRSQKRVKHNEKNS